MQLDFRSLYTFTFNLDFNLSLNLITLLFILFPIYWYHPQYISFIILNLTYTSKNFYISNQVRFRSVCSPSGLSVTGLHIRDFYYFVNTLTDKIYIYIKEKFELYLARLLSILLLRIFKSTTSHNLTNRQFI